MELLYLSTPNISYTDSQSRRVKARLFPPGHLHRTLYTRIRCSKKTNTHGLNRRASINRSKTICYRHQMFLGPAGSAVNQDVEYFCISEHLAFAIRNQIQTLISSCVDMQGPWTCFTIAAQFLLGHRRFCKWEEKDVWGMEFVSYALT